MRGTWKALSALLGTVSVLAVCQGCALPEASEASEDVASTSEDALSIPKGAGAGEIWFNGVDPCDKPVAFAKKHGFNLIVMKKGEKTKHGTSKNDLIIGTPDDDVIFGEGGDDIICAGEGEDTVHGGPGKDYIDGGGDNDTLYGDEGNDLIHGRGGSDEIHGGSGDDMLFGDILDDRIFGEGGDDLLIGGHGTDLLDGGPGNDFLRGDTGNDFFQGGPGKDTLSFATAMPPGQGDSTVKASPINGVKVDFNDRCEKAGETPDGGYTRSRHQGCANGDGGNEPIDGIEIVIGSPYSDILIRGGSGVEFVSTYGEDKCDGAPCGKGLLPADAKDKVFVTLDNTPRDTGLIVIGTDDPDSIDIIRAGGSFRVEPNAGTKLFAGPGCKFDGGAVECDPGKFTPYWLAAWMGEGGDTVKLADAAGSTKRFWNDFTAHVNGGNGDDKLSGGDEQDVLFSGPTGKDILRGGGGDDALFSESRKYPAMDCSKLSKEQQAKNPRCDQDKPRGNKYEDGRDELYGGAGNDQLVADYPCGKHLFSGGGGTDIAGFARSGKFGITGQLAGKAKIEKAFHGKAYNPDLCGLDDATRFVDDLEIFESSDGDDELWGNDKANTFWGREGDDVIHGLGGDDDIQGLLGDDKLYGGEGKDNLAGAGGKNETYDDAD